MTEMSFWAQALTNAFIVLASACAVIASLERILGRPIPRLRYSRPVRRNRAFAAVLFAMAWVYPWMLIAMLRMQVCSHCTYSRGWQNPAWILESAVMALGFSSVVGWMVYAVVWIASSSLRLVARYT
ncbi:MAG: hypothetical protein M3O35_06150 [Acidobacteriota bacterium]|nr:hypothetical protein [Acidobacteriota bacterium]